MLVVDQLQELAGVWNKILDVMRYDVSVSPHCRVGCMLTSSSRAWTQWRMTRMMRARRKGVRRRWTRKERATRRGTYDSWAAVEPGLSWGRGVACWVAVPMAHE